MIADAYFVCRPEDVKGYVMTIMPDNDILPLDVIVNSAVIYQDDDKVICHCRLDESLINELALQAETDNPLDISAVKAIGIEKTYLGRERESVFERFPELRGTKTIQTENGSQEIDIVNKNVWL